MTLKVLELFGGIGACTAALKRLGIDIEIVDYVEIDKYACASYNAINGTDFKPQDITKWDKQIDVDFCLHGSPCTDFSLAGLQKGGDKGSGTHSSLMYETIRIVEKLRPKYVIWENVANLLSEKHFHNFANYINALGELGYASAYKVLNSKDYGIPQNRERVFTISVLGGRTLDLFGYDLDYKFPEPFKLEKRLKDILEENANEKYYLTSKQIEQIKHWNAHQNPLETLTQTHSQQISSTLTTKAADYSAGMILIYGNRFPDNSIPIKNATGKGYLLAQEGDGIDISARMEYHRGTVQKGISQTITTAGGGRKRGISE